MLPVPPVAAPAVARRHRRSPRGAAACALLALLVAAGCGAPDLRPPAPAVSVPSPSPSPSPDDGAGADAGAPGTAVAGTALAAVVELEVKGRAPRTGYDRDLFGHGWVDVDRNGCDTRNDVLARDLAHPTVEPGTHGCVVLTGTLVDPFSGATIEFVRGQGTSELVQIDHVVALSDAWQKGAQQWEAATRVAFANDPLNLLAVDGALNQQKGDGDTATWLPPDAGFRCAYVARQVAVKRAYDLWVTQAEADAMVRVLRTCPDEPLPTDAAGPVRPSAPALVEPPVAPPANPGDAVDCGDFASWTQAQAWYDTYRPAYGDVAGLDGDDDGVACETLPGAP
ncbi:HNH endonuclease family protein [Actinotalea sp. JY-7876]|uniref:HNH endonuclease family protein n=2 Tax=unclassified Actinotalea TaxID=2638618 RepID=UPI002101FDE3|nr:HNH endonuclease family protein [Actinotalea sp. JY-7876]